MGLVFGGLAALFIGSSDFMAARTGKLVPSAAIARTTMLLALVLVPFLPVFGSPFSWSDEGFAAMSGVLLALGLLLLYRGYGRAAIGIVAPTCSVLLGLVPVVYDLLQGVRPRPITLGGMALGLLALVFTTYTRDGGGDAKLGFVFGASSGLLFGIGFTLMAQAKAGGLNAVVTQRLAGFALLMVLVKFDKAPVTTWKTPARWLGIVTGGLALTGIACLQFGFRHGSAGLVAVASSQFATVAVILSVIFNRDRLRWWQAFGVCMTAVAVALMSVG